MIIVTGGYGFIGSNIVHELNKRGYTDILVVDDLTNGAAYKNLLGAKFLYYIDVDQLFSRFNEWNKVTAIYHQGAMSSTTETNGKIVMDRNYQFTLDLLDKCAEHKIPVSYASSASVYGNKQDKSFDPLNLYAYSKMLVDEWVLHNLNSFKLVQGWRYFNVYGNREDHKGDQCSPVTKFKKQVQSTGTIKLFEGSADIYRDFIAVDDVVKIVVNAMMPGMLSSGIRDLGTGRVTSFETVARLIQRKYGGKIQIVPFPENLKPGYQWLTRAQPLVANSSFTSLADWLDQQ